MKKKTLDTTQFTYKRFFTDFLWRTFKNDVLLGFARMGVNIFTFIVNAAIILYFPIKVILEFLATTFFVLYNMTRKDKQ